MKKLISIVLTVIFAAASVCSASALTIGEEGQNQGNKIFKYREKLQSQLLKSSDESFTYKRMKSIWNRISYFMFNAESIDFGDAYANDMIKSIAGISCNMDFDDIEDENAVPEHFLIEVDMYKLNDRKIELFKKYISDSDAVVLWNTKAYPIVAHDSISSKTSADMVSVEGVNRIKIACGKEKSIPAPNKRLIKRWSSSNPSVISVKNGKITALKKGNATITASYGSALKIKFRYKVKNNPKLCVKKKQVTSIKLKKGGSRTLTLIGRAKSLKNTYKSTKYAKIISSKSSDKIKIKGLRKGKTTLKIRVNGTKTIKLKVRVI